MKLLISNDLTTQQVQDQFSKFYEFLKLEFFKIPHEEKEPSSRKFMIKEPVPLMDLNNEMVNGSIEVSDTMTVQELESILRENFGLFVQVFRKSGTVWLETSVTDSMTLKVQNAMGKEKTIAVKAPDITNIDYD